MPYLIKILKKIQPFSILLGLVVVLFLPFFFSTKLFPGFDPLLIFYPYSHHFLNQQSFWASSILSGFGVKAVHSWAGNWFYYNFENGQIFDFIGFYNLIILFYFILTLVFSFLAARRLGFDKWVSVLVSSVYIFSAYNLSWMVAIITAASLFIFPAIIYFLLKFKEHHNWIWPFLGGFALGFGLIMSHPQFALIAVFGGSLFSLFLVFEEGFKSPKWIFLFAFLTISLIGLALAAFQLIPEYQSVQLTQRGAALSFQDSQECALIPLDFVRYFIPNFNFLVSCESLLYVGVLPLILAVLAIFYSRIEKKRIFFWTFLLAFSILFSMKYSPLAWIFHQLPIWQSVRSPGHFLMLSGFALAVLAGFGFNWILSTYGRSPEGRENKESFKEFKVFRWVKRIFLGFLFLIIAINIFGLFKGVFIKWAQYFFDKYYYSKTIGLPLSRYHQAIENIISGNFYAFSFFNKDFTIPFILTISAFLIIIFIYKFNKTTLFYVFLLCGFTWAISSPMVSSGLSRDFFDETSVINFLKSQKSSPFRVYSLMPGLSTYQLLVLTYPDVTESDQNEFFKTMLPPNLNLIYGIDSIDGYDVSMPRRTARLLAELLSERATVGNKIAEARLKPDEKIKIFENQANLLSMMNVKYVVSAYQFNEKIFKKVFETKTTRFRIPIYIYENPDIMPRFYWANKTKVVFEDEIETFKKIMVPGVDFSEKTFIECQNVSECENWGNGKGEIVNSEYRDGYLKLAVGSKEKGWLVFSESYNNNWQVLISGVGALIYRANYVYQAVQVPAGKNTIEFIYKP